MNPFEQGKVTEQLCWLFFIACVVLYQVNVPESGFCAEARVQLHPLSLRMARRRVKSDHPPPGENPSTPASATSGLGLYGLPWMDPWRLPMSARYLCGKRETPRCPLRLPLEKCCSPRGRSLSPAIGAGSTSRDITQLLSSKNFGFLLMHWKKKPNQNPKPQFFPFHNL